jgi:hypothetical protein
VKLYIATGVLKGDTEKACNGYRGQRMEGTNVEKKYIKEI